jgi:hypothetical protein
LRGQYRLLLVPEDFGAPAWLAKHAPAPPLLWLGCLGGSGQIVLHGAHSPASAEERRLARAAAAAGCPWTPGASEPATLILRRRPTPESDGSLSDNLASAIGLILRLIDAWEAMALPAGENAA